MENRKNNFNIIRWMALVMVMYGHQFVLLGKEAPIFLGVPIHGVGVRILFLISGYLVMKSYENNDNCRLYFLKRIVRIFPTLIFVTLITVFISMFFTTIMLGDYFKYSASFILHNILLSPKFDLPGVFAENYYPIAVNGSLWTLPIEVLCYFLIPILFKLSKSKYKEIILITCWGIGIIIAILMEFGRINSMWIFWGTDWIGAWKIAIYFIIGGIIACLKVEKIFHLQIASLLLIILIGFNINYQNILIFIMLPYIFLSFALSDKPLFYKFMNKIECSYGMYLWGFFVQQSLIYVICIKQGEEISVSAMFMLSFCISLVLSFITYYLLENPMKKIQMRYIMKFIRK